MKKFLFLTCMVLIGVNLFGQINFSVDGNLATNFTNAVPTLGFQINFDKLDILAGVKFRVYNSDRTDKNYQTFNTNSELSQHVFELFGGLAPKVALTENWTLSFPILAEISFREDEVKYDSNTVYSADSIKGTDYFRFALNVGPRAYYALSKSWNIYLGFLFQIFNKTDITNTYWKNSSTTTYTREQNNIVWFENGEMELGIRFIF